MTFSISLAAVLLVSYLAGSIPFGFVIGKCHGVDIRREGSGNIGATNVTRVIGPWWGKLCFLLDFLKGFLASGAVILLTGSGTFSDPAGILPVARTHLSRIPEIQRRKRDFDRGGGSLPALPACRTHRIGGMDRAFPDNALCVRRQHRGGDCPSGGGGHPVSVQTARSDGFASGGRSLHPAGRSRDPQAHFQHQTSSERDGKPLLQRR